ncbi:MAG: M3 family metallopeptidase [Alloprevotella sp.]
MNTFIRSQILSDGAWADALRHGFHLEPDAESPTDLLRRLVKEGMKQELEEVEAIAANPEAPTFENTIVAFTRCGELLSRATTVMYNLFSAETSDALDELVNELSPVLTAHSNAIMLNEALFRRVKAVSEQPQDDLTTEDKVLLEKTLAGFRRSGAALSEEDKETYRSLTTELSKEVLLFSQRLLKETNRFTLHVADHSRLAGLTELQLASAAETAREKGLEGWVFTLQAPSYVPFMAYCDDRALREELYRAHATRCTHGDDCDNREAVRKIVNLRQQIAQLLGYDTYASYALERRMAEKSENVHRFLEELLEAYLPVGRADVRAVEEQAQKNQGADFRLQPWDYAYYARQLKEERYHFDPDSLRPYFELSAVIRGVFGLATRLYGITFHEADIPVYHPDVKAYRVEDADGSFLGVLFADFFPREGKKGGAWMTDYRGEHADISSSETVNNANSVRPVVSLTTNFSKPTADTPSLLTFSEVETLLHEFGHVLHGLFAMSHYEALSGTNVFWDFVELPSQFMENFSTEPEFLATFARHYHTGEPLPTSYVDALRAARQFQAGYHCLRQLSFGFLDMAFYDRESPLTDDVTEFECRAMEKTALLPRIPEACMAVSFGHIMSGGYAAGYYSYKWAEVLDADAFSLFRERGVFDAATASAFRDCILSKGGTEHPSVLFQRFRGRTPSIDALLKRDGIK